MPDDMAPEVLLDGDESALGQLQALLRDAARDLFALRVEPLLIASSPNKFNDAGNDLNWVCVQVGDEVWQTEEYYPRPEPALDEHLIRSARKVLSGLEKDGWRDLLERASGERASGEEIVAIVIQHGVAWFVVSASNTGRDSAFAIRDDGSLLFVGCPERLDDRLGAEHPFFAQTLDPAAWLEIQDSLRFHPLGNLTPPSTDEARRAADRLNQLLVPLSDQIMRAYAEANEDRVRQYGVETGRTRPWPWLIEVEEVRPLGGSYSYSSYSFSIPPEHGRVETTPKSVDPGDAPPVARLRGGEGRAFPALGLDVEQIFNELEAAHWRQLFAQAFTPIKGSLPQGRASAIRKLGLLVKDVRFWVIAYETSVLAFNDRDELEIVGVCDQTTTMTLTGPGDHEPKIHLFADQTAVDIEASE